MQTRHSHGLVAMNDDQIRAAVLHALAEAAPGAAPDCLDPNIPFRDQFDFDSVDFVNFVFALERSLGIEVNELDCPHLSTLDGCMRFVRMKGAA